MKFRKTGYIVLGLAACLLTGCAAMPQQKKFERQTFYFDTLVRISFYAGENGEELMEHCLDLCEELQKTFDRTDSESELYAVNHRGSSSVEVSDALAHLVETGLSYYEVSEGKFDITVAPLDDLWDFKSEDARVPEKQKIAAALDAVGASSVHVDGNVLLFDSPDTRIDLGALVKGYAADALKEYLKGQGVTSGLLDLGGNVLAIGAKPDQSAWRIGIQKPFAERGETAAVLDVTDQSVVSSGVYERYFQQDGRIYHHILDPQTGYPVENELDGVSILCDSSLEGDALSTTCLALGLSKAQELVESMDGVEAVFVQKDGQVLFTDEDMRQ